MDYSDKEILVFIQRGEDDKALSFLYKKILPKIRQYVKTNNGDDDEAYDIFQDGIMIFYKQVKESKFNEEYEIGGFIYTVCRNLWINRVKRKNRNVSIDHVADPGRTEDNALNDLISEEREAYVMKMLSDLGERCKELLLYSIFYKFSMKEICEKMGFSTENAAKTRNYKCKQKLVGLVKDNLAIKDLLR